MKKTETIRFSVRPEMKDGLKLFFKGKKYSDVFESIIEDYLKRQIQKEEQIIKDFKDTIKGSMGRTPEYITYLENEMHKYEEKTFDLLTVFNKCFPFKSSLWKKEKETTVLLGEVKG